MPLGLGNLDWETSGETASIASSVVGANWRVGVIKLDSIAGRLRRAGWGEYRLGREVIDALLLPSDIRKIRKQHRKVFGSRISLLRPRTFNEKLQSSKILARRPRHVRFADKLAVRDFVRERIGPEVLTELLWTGLDLKNARRQALPRRFVLKANHASARNLIVDNASLFDWEKSEALCRKWLEEDYSDHFAEWQYRWIPRKLFIEEYLEGPDGNVPLDYKFFCFHGRVEMVQVDFDRHSNHTRALLDRNFSKLAVKYHHPLCRNSIVRPDCYEEMRYIAECLSAGETFLRVDLYDLGRPIFGELTLHPEAAIGKFVPPEWDKRLGELW